jgi:hypothetical protein
MPPALPPKHTNTTRTLTEGSLRCLPETALHHTNTHEREAHPPTRALP